MTLQCGQDRLVGMVKKKLARSFVVDDRSQTGVDLQPPADLRWYRFRTDSGEMSIKTPAAARCESRIASPAILPVRGSASRGGRTKRGAFYLLKDERQKRR